MSTLYITELNLTNINNANFTCQPEVASQTVTVSGTTAASSAFATNTNLVRLH